MSRDACEAKTKIPKRWLIGRIATLGTFIAMADPAALHSGQICDEVGCEVRSAQKWNCAARKTSPKNSAQNRMLCDGLRMCLVRRSLGKNGCEVKNWAITAECTLTCGEPRLVRWPARGCLRFGQFRAVGPGTARRYQAREVNSRRSRVPGGLRGSCGSIQRLEPVRRVLQRRLILRERLRGTPQLRKHVRQHFARGHGQRVHSIAILAVSSRAQRLQRVF